jgi:hypothetical protein
MSKLVPSFDRRENTDVCDCGAGLRQSSRRSQVLYGLGLLALILWTFVSG